VLRHLTVKMTKAIVDPSPMMKEEKSRSMMERSGEAKPADVPAAGAAAEAAVAPAST
jgi:small subunit ribosomal protein S6